MGCTQTCTHLQSAELAGKGPVDKLAIKCNVFFFKLARTHIWNGVV